MRESSALYSKHLRLECLSKQHALQMKLKIGKKDMNRNYIHHSIYFSLGVHALLEVKLPYDQVCLSVGQMIGLSVGLQLICHIFLNWWEVFHAPFRGLVFHYHQFMPTCNNLSSLNFIAAIFTLAAEFNMSIAFFYILLTFKVLHNKVILSCFNLTTQLWMLKCSLCA